TGGEKAEGEAEAAGEGASPEAGSGGGVEVGSDGGTDARGCGGGQSAQERGNRGVAGTGGRGAPPRVRAPHRARAAGGGAGRWVCARRERRERRLRWPRVR